mmetsp:Transcript_10293/g.20689  ORF Transcript_10293/g.20689 Transcript_10293/m.20689 type:complete len:81 (+) Transcript_10293:580-822(+)
MSGFSPSSPDDLTHSMRIRSHFLERYSQNTKEQHLNRCARRIPGNDDLRLNKKIKKVAFKRLSYNLPERSGYTISITDVR